MNLKPKKLTTGNQKALTLAFAALIAGSSIFTACSKDETVAPAEKPTIEAVTSPMMLATDATAAATTLDLRINLGGNAVPTNYNKAILGVSSAVALKDYNTGVVTAVKLATVATFKGSYNNPETYPSTLGIPTAVASDLFYGSGTTAAFELSGLNTATGYNLSFFASRMDYTGSLETQYKVIGATTQTVVLEAANNTSKFVSVTGIKPNSTGKIRIEVSKGPKNTNSAGNYWLNYMSVTGTTTTTTAPAPAPAPIDTTTAPAPAPAPAPTPSYNYLVKTVADLKAAVSKATSGQVIYVDNSAQIDFTGQGTLKIPAGVTLMSGRGDNGALGGMIYTTNLSQGILIQAGGTNVKVIGLRVRGASTGTSGSSTYNRGIYTTYSNLEVANCEIFGWNHAGVYLTGGAANVNIHHNYFHHNQQSGLGYGISMSQAYAKITYNYFNYNRHCIAGSGIPGSGYEAAYNVVMPNATEHSFDMHGYGGDGAQYPAGDYVNCHDNTFYMGAYASITVRGTPKNGTTIINNKFVSTQSKALNLYATNNTISGNTFSIPLATVNPGPATM